MVQITKRDGRVVPFDPAKITNAILKAMHETELGEDSYLANSIADKIAAIPDQLSVEEIQDIVEESLMESSRKDAAKRYIIYRNERTNARMKASTIFSKVMSKTTGASVENANANVDEASFGGRKAEAASIIQKEIALTELMSRDVTDAHNAGLIYQHDLDSYSVGMHNCLNIDFGHVLNSGFVVRNGDVRPPQTLATACQQIAVIFQAQSQGQFGGVGACSLDRDLAPYVKKSFRKHFMDALYWIGGMTHEEIAALPENSYNIDDKQISGTREYAFAMEMLEREGKQSMEALVHNLNSLESRSGSQVPFTSINYGRDTSTEGRLITKWLIEASIAGIGEHHSTSIFPIGIFSYKKGVNASSDDPNYDLKKFAIESLSRRIYPNFANGDWSEAHEDPNDPDTIFSTMG